MSENSAISWTDHTFNIVWGCVEVSPACDHCYAREFSQRLGRAMWGADTPRYILSDHYWNEPGRWNRKALQAFGRPARVFCSSMADVFEVHPQTEGQLARLWPVIEETPNLEWLLLTKRWDQIRKKLPEPTPKNVRMGVTVESAEYAYRITDRVDWLSMEPLLGPVDLTAVPGRDPLTHEETITNVLSGEIFGQDGARIGTRRPVSWVIVGGESEDDRNPKARGTARKMEMAWALNLMGQCHEYGVAYHFKQTGHRLAEELRLKNKAGKEVEEWPVGLRIQEFPKVRAA